MTGKTHGRVLIVFLLLLACSASPQQNPDPHTGKVPRCDNAHTTPPEQRCACNRTTTCPDKDAPLPEDQKCRSFCFKGCGCIGPCTT